jgi:hypothetical protein
MMGVYDFKDVIVDALFRDGLIDGTLYSKCKKESYSILPFSNQLKGALNDFVDKIASRKKNEVWVGYNSNGDLLSSNVGDDGSVVGDYEGASSSMVMSVCKDIVDGYDGEGDLEELIIERLNSLGDKGRVFAVHNHPTAYIGTTKNNPVPTCLSEDDCENNEYRVDIAGYGGVFLYNLVRSETCICRNGTMMTLINNNPIGKSRGYSLVDYNRAVGHLTGVWRDYVRDIESHTRKQKRGIVRSLREKYLEGGVGVDVDVKSMEKLIRKEATERVNSFIKEQNRDLYPNEFRDVVREFNELGFDLRFDVDGRV